MHEPFDLHCHSHRSDGTLSPAALFERAAQRGIRTIALTDHDELGGLTEAAHAARVLGLNFVPGVEISSEFDQQSVHIVGLGIDPDHHELRVRLGDLRSWRQKRAEAIAEGLEAAGVHGALDGALHYASNPELISRTHFARYLVDAGYCASRHEVFARYMKPGKPGFVPHHWLPLPEAIALIRAAGGVAVLAHPARYELSPDRHEVLLKTFKQHGGEGIEVVCAAHGPEEWARYAAVARRMDLYASLGSDFHAPEESRIDFGQLPLLARSLPCILERLASHA